MSDLQFEGVWKFTACMGGFCRVRESCRNYHSVFGRNQPAQRLCPPGRDVPIFLDRPAPQQPEAAA